MATQYIFIKKDSVFSVNFVLAIIQYYLDLFVYYEN